MIQIENKERCCGCTSCVSVCPHGAITMRADGLGFLYPEVDKDLCVDCGLCDKVCAFDENYDKSSNLPDPDIYAVRHKKISEVETSRSGAMFVALSDYVLENGGVVYGAGYTGHFRVTHKRALSKEERDEFKGSKYVQSFLGDTFKNVCDDLRKGMIVMFSGTPCQTSGLRSLVKLKRVPFDRLYVCDIVCHGVPSSRLWEDYLNYMERKEGKRVLRVDFRDKRRFGWKAHKESFELEGGYYTCTYYTYLFYQHIMFRHSCAVCPFTNYIRPSDITIADYWGWERLDKNLNTDDRGVSLVLVNSAKGQDWFEKVNKDIDYVRSDKEKCWQAHLSKPSEMHPNREAFEQDYKLHGFEYVMRKYGNIGWHYWMRRVMNKIRRMVRKGFVR